MRINDLTNENTIEEMPASLRNDPDGHTIVPHGGMGSGKEETWKSVSTRKLQQVIDMIESGNYTGAEHVLYKNGFLQGAVQALARYEEFKTKQGKRPMARGKEVNLGEHGKASRELCKSSKPDADLGASMLSSCKSQGLRARDGEKSHKLGKDKKSRIKVGGHRIKGQKYGGPLPDWS
jgi:hypothetical protein